MRETNDKKIAFYMIALHSGGGEKVILDLARGFAEEGFSVDLILFRREGSLKEKIDSRINILELKVSRIAFSLFPLVKYLNKEKPLFILGTSEHANIILLLAKLVSRTKTKVLVRVGMTFSDLFKNYKKKRDRLIPFLIKTLYPYADKIIANSQNVAIDLEKVSKIPKDKIEIIYNPKFVEEIREKSLDRFTNAREDGGFAVAPSRRTGSQKQKQTGLLRRKLLAKTTVALPPSLREVERSGMTKQSRKQNNWDFPDKFTILATGRLEKQKDFGTLIKAFALVKNKIDAQLVILGEGGEKDNLKDLVRALDLEEFIHLVGFVDNPYFYMNNSDIFVSTSLWEGFSNVLIEAGILGLPIIATDCGSGSRELLAPGSDFNKQLEKGRIEYADNGILVAKQDIDMLAEAILILSEDDLLRDNYSKKIKEKTKEFEIKNILKQIKNSL